MYDKDQTFESRINGIIVHRKGMSIERKSVEFLGPELASHVTGYAIGDSVLDDELRYCEEPEHFDFRYNNSCL